MIKALRYPVKHPNTPTPGTALPDQRIKLKKVLNVMLLRNLDPASAHFNVARFELEDSPNSFSTFDLPPALSKATAWVFRASLLAAPMTAFPCMASKEYSPW